MIQVTVFKDSKEHYFTGFHTYGHAEYADEGYDIICSAVSAIIIMTINSIDELTEDEVKVKEDQEAGEIRLKFMNIPSESSTLLIRSMLLGLHGIEAQYGEKYLKVNTKEV